MSQMTRMCSLKRRGATTKNANKLKKVHALFFFM